MTEERENLEIDIEGIIDIIRPVIKVMVVRQMSEDSIKEIIGKEILVEVGKTIQTTISEVVVEVLKKKLNISK